MKRLLIGLVLLLAACGGQPGVTTQDFGGFRVGTIEYDGMECVVLFSGSGYIERGIDCDWTQR